MAPWAADCAGRVLPYFEEERPEDDRPRRAVEAGTAHMAAYAPHAAGYAARAVAHAGGCADPDTAVAERRDLQHRSLSEHLRPVVFLGR